MTLTIFHNFIRITFLILLQALIVSRMQVLDGFILPWIYIFGILMIPFETPKWAVLLIAFATGYIMDLFSGPMGMHMTACVVLGWLQPFVQKLLSPREGYDIVQRPTIQKMGLQWYLTYAGLLTFIHHFVLFFAETLRLTPFFYHIGHILFSSIATLLLMTIGQYLIFAQKGNE
jgi:hypothetical protein